MAEANDSHKNHIIFSGRTTSERYQSTLSARDSFEIRQRDRTAHGRRIKSLIESVRDDYNKTKDEELPDGIVRDAGVYVDFISDYNVKLKFDSFHSEQKNGFKLLSCQKVEKSEQEVYKALVFVPEKGIASFIKKIESYLDEGKDSEKEDGTRTPRNNKLIANIDDIRVATLRSFWTTTHQPFPENDEVIWWEVWLRKKDIEGEVDKVVNQLLAVEATVGSQRIEFPEHEILLVSASPEQLSNSILLLDNLAELRTAKETADFFTEMGLIAQEEWLDDFYNRIENHTTSNSFAICILDSGVQNGHRLIQDFLPDENMDSYNPDWGRNDTYGGSIPGHGTPMAGLALYGDLSDQLHRTENIQIYHQLECVKVIPPSGHPPNERHLLGAVTEESVSRATVMSPDRKRAFCMAVTYKDDNDGRPSSYSASVDKIAFGVENGTNPQLILVSGGNVQLETPSDFPTKNELTAVEDPAHAYNAVTIGAYTEKAIIDTSPEESPGSEPLSNPGGMSPINSTSLIWSDSFPIKPDVVFEGGNLGVQQNGLIYPDSLALLSTSRRVNPFCSFSDTSAATALAANFIAKLSTQYPTLWHETTRGLMIHSADWTSEMLGGRDFNTLSTPEKREVLRTVGYGVPNLEKALYSASNQLTLVAERIIQPYVLERGSSSAKFNEMHLFELPWPVETLEQLFAQSVKMVVTLSYYIEPLPGEKYTASKYDYRSHGLKFDVIRNGEDLEEFRQGVNKLARDSDFRRTAGTDNWYIGVNGRTKGSIHKDIWEGTAAELATKKYIAVYPSSGWWKNRKVHKRYNDQVRYSLIVSIESESSEVDIYTPVMQQVGITV